MTAHYRHIKEAGPAVPIGHFPAKHPLPAKNIEEFARDVVIFTPVGRNLDAAISRARVDLPGLAGSEVVHRVMSHNPDSLWAIARRDNFDAAAAVPEGFVAFLMLNGQGLRRLLEGTFDASDPGPDLAVQPAPEAGGNLCVGDVGPGRTRRRHSLGFRKSLDADLQGRRSLCARRDRRRSAAP